MRFLKGVLQRNSGKQTEAIATFIKLNEDYPALSEPYNNLAVIYAGQSQYDKARAALEMAIRTNPSYATAYENQPRPGLAKTLRLIWQPMPKNLVHLPPNLMLLGRKNAKPESRKNLASASA